MFSPGSSTQERDRKMDVGMTALLTMSIILLMLIDLMPKTQLALLPWMGGYNNAKLALTVMQRW